MRAIDELTEVDDPAWPELAAVLAASPVPARVLPADRDEGRRCLLQLQVTARSVLGALVLHTGGLLLDHGWVRVFGGGAPAAGGGPADGGAAEDGGAADGGLPSLGRVNRFPTAFDPAWHPATALVVGHDAVGGVFALNGHDPAAGGRPGIPGQMTYFAPDTLEWEALDMGHSAWVSWLLSGGTEAFYDGLRWPGWRAEAEELALSQGITVFPFLWSEEAHADLSGTARRAVPMREVLGVAADFARQLGAADPGFLGVV
ncbi:DUF2625 family protein [Kitasatospora sp. NPDC101447]|uniref:DUF2625 family protein n=1 Tax=Kitasatospora sp. NPDC101447 TaxID=3364102 RepID=UPI003800DA02